MHYFERVVVALAMAPVDREVVRYARLLNDMGRGQTRCTFVHVLPPADVAARTDAPTPSLIEARSALQGVVNEAFGPTEYDLKVISGHLIDSLLAEAVEGHADLVLVGHRRDSRGRRSLSRRLALKAPCSVWMVPEGSPARIGGVLAAVDLSLPSAQALGLATIVASRAGLSQCTVLHVEDPSPIGYDIVERESLERALERFLSPLDLHGVTAVTRIDEAGSVSRAVNAIVEKGQHDLVVVGTRGRSLSAAVLLGSESEHVLVESRVPVLITKQPGERIGILRALMDREFRFQSRPPRFG